MWRCLKDLMGYCDGELEWEVEAREVWHGSGATGVYRGRCAAEPDSCGKHLTQADLLARGEEERC